MSIKDIFKEYNIPNTKLNEMLSIVDEYEESKELIYEIIGLLNNDMKIDDIITELKNEHFGWDNKIFNNYKKIRQFRDTMLSKPPEVREGDIQCPKCHLYKTVVVEMQTRSADEGFTYSIHCLNPKCMKISK
jgi:DNA-directed RNA polymerase subunit M/transcription elongation factor TFIIS